MTKINSLIPQIINYAEQPSKDELTSSSINAVTPIKDEAISSFKLFGLHIAGLDLAQISNTKLSLEVPLQAGNKRINTNGKDAHIIIRPHTTAHLDIELAKNSDNQLVMKSFQMQFNRSIRIKNPVASLLNENKVRTTSTRIKDKIADLKLKGIAINQQGQIGVDAKVNAFKIINTNLSALQGTIKLPAINDALLVQLGIIPTAKNTDTPMLSDLSEQFHVQRLLKNLGTITELARYSLEVSGEARKIVAKDDSKTFQGREKPFHAKIAGSLDLNDQGDAVIVIDKSPISFSLGNYDVNGQIKIGNLGSALPTRLEATGSLAGSTTGMMLDGFCRETVKKVFPERGSVPRTEVIEPKHDKDVHYEISADEITLSSNFHLNAELRRSNLEINGSVDSSVLSKNPYIKIDDNGAKFSGAAALDLNLRNLHYSKRDGLNTTKGNLNVRVEPDKKTLESFPEIKPTEWQYKLRMDSENKARIKVPQFGASRFVRPVKNLEAHYDRVDTPSTRQIYEIGSADYFRQLQQISGAKLRSARDLRWLIDGKESMAERLTMIEHAKEHICLQSFEFRDDKTGWQMARALVNAKNRGVNVHVIVDSIGNTKAIKELAKPQPIYDYLKQHGIRLEIYNAGFEQGLRRIFGITQLYPHVFNVPEKKSFHNISGLINFLKQVLHEVDNERNSLSINDRNALKQSIHLLYGGSNETAPEESINELRHVLSEPIVDLSKLLSTLKRMGDTNYRSHEKYFIVDNNAAIIGGMNIADAYLGGTDKREEVSEENPLRYRDMDLKLEGEAVTEIYRNFRRNWWELSEERLPYEKPPYQQGNYAVSIIDHRPKEDGDHKVVNFYLYNLRSLKAGEKAWFETAYFLPRAALRPLQEELINAAKRGVDVRILTNSVQSSDFGHLVEAAVFDYRDLLKAGGRIFERKDNQMVHAKVAILGERLCTVGSANLDNRSEKLDREAVCAVFNEQMNRELSVHFERDMFAESNEVTLESIKTMPIKNEVKAAGMHLLSELI